ncbi:DUF86 domain-containing protein [Zunongwangia sp. F260]|uniref:DUF86 domain-containing protein n=1 Tax=Autumnicola lenta TaxID=3075593 RepID=A0ABU3CPM3_9FLAO|nr:HepT-like ribonuclease domain-containing protein [Zunongwangia sp. F260]MDT0648281.1 DUF86 domain-containing protein [Zunongwangia sp. F260]
MIHAYDSVDNAIVWVIVKKNLPELKRDCVSLIQQLGESFKTFNS